MIARPVFVYGTLQPGHERWPLVAPYVVGHASDTVRGRLFDTGLGYPAAVFGDGSVVEGVVLELSRPAHDDAVELLDGIEGVAVGLFRRVDVTTLGGVAAFAYELGGAFAGLRELDRRWPDQP